MRRKFSSRRSKPLRPGALPRVTGPPDGVGPFLSDGAARRRGPERWIGSTEPETVSPPGAMRSKPQTPRAGRLGSGGLAVLSDFSVPRRCEAAGSVGPPGPESVPRALDSFRRGGNPSKDRRSPRRTQTTGAAELCLPSFRGAHEVREPGIQRQARTGSSGFRVRRHKRVDARLDALWGRPGMTKVHLTRRCR